MKFVFDTFFLENFDAMKALNDEKQNVKMFKVLFIQGEKREFFFSKRQFCCDWTLDE